jgi:hypothetical protein
MCKMSNNNSVFIKDVLTNSEKNKYAMFFRLPEKVFEKCLGVLDVLNFDPLENGDHHRLLLFHYAIHNAERFHTFGEEFTPEVIHSLLAIRGIIVAERGDEISVVCSSYGYTKVHVTDQISDCKLCDIEGNAIEVTYKEWIQGALVRIFKYNGTVYASTHRKISCRKSRFGSSSKTFEEMLLQDQDTFSSLDLFFNDIMSNTHHIHLFMLNNRDLVIESGVSLTEDSIYYVGTIVLFDIENPTAGRGRDAELISMPIKSYITEQNEGKTKPIKFPRILSVEGAQATLTGSATTFTVMPNLSLRGVNSFLRTLPVENCLDLYRTRGSVICHFTDVATGLGVFRILPTSKRSASLIMGGVPNPAKIFTDLLARYGNDTLFDEIPLNPVGFTIGQLVQIANRIHDGVEFDISEFPLELESLTVPELILTNVVFSSPSSLVMDAIKAYRTFGSDVIAAAEFLFENRGTVGSEQGLENAIKQKNDRLFDGFMNLNKSTKGYLMSKYLACFIEVSNLSGGYNIDFIINGGPKSFWHRDVTRKFQDNAKNYTRENKQRNALLALVSNAPPDALYSLLQFKSKVLKTRESFAKGKLSV